MQFLKVGDPAPTFVATASDGRKVDLADYKGRQPVVLFFYPRDHSLICTQEVCAFRDVYEDLRQLGAVVIGVSGDSDESHRSFAVAQQLPYFLIADTEGALRQLFGVPNSLYVIPGRVTYVIDRDGIVRKIFNSQLLGSRHAEEALLALRKLSETSKG